ncbi:MAG: hypothetical protein OXU53_05255 [Deltaproteobacteria bacterium]|nr:hypothetical protein [Deltaproteobacteria bacterium]
MSEASTPNNPPLLTEDDREFLAALLSAPSEPPLLGKGDFYDAEERVLNAFLDGWNERARRGVAGARPVIVLPDGSGIPESPNSKDMQDATLRAGEKATLRASFLRSLFLGSYGSFAPRSVIISRARIEGRLDLDYCKPCFPLMFHECIFSQGISLRAATIPELILIKCLIDHKRGSSLFAQQVQVNTDVHLHSVANGKVDLSDANIDGLLNCESAHFKKGLEARGLKTGSNVLLKYGFKSDGEVNLHSANIGDQLSCHGGHFKMGLTAQNLKTGRDVLLKERFKSDGEVDLLGADIGGVLSCEDSYFGEGLMAQNLKTGTNVFLRGNFKSNGKVVLSEANIGGQLACDGGYFGKGLIAQNLKVGTNVLLRKGFKSNGQVDLLCADIGGVLACPGTDFKNGLVVDGLRYQYIELDGGWKRGLSWLSKMPESSKEFSPQPYEQLMMVYRRMGHPDWARQIGFKLEEKRHKRIAFELENERHERTVSDLEREECRRFFKGRFKGFEKRLWRAWYSILKCTIGYGYKPFRSLGWVVGLLLGGTILFSDCIQQFSSKFTSSGDAPKFLANEWIPSEEEAYTHWKENNKQAPQEYPEFQPFVYSLEAAFPVLPLGLLDTWRPVNPCFWWVRWIWTVIGSGLLAILALFGVGVLRPTWKSEGDGG